MDKIKIRLDGGTLEESIATLKEILGLRPDQSFEDLPEVPDEDDEAEESKKQGGR